jgi:hypothetical protein
LAAGPDTLAKIEPSVPFLRKERPRRDPVDIAQRIELAGAPGELFDDARPIGRRVLLEIGPALAAAFSIRPAKS